MILLLLSTVGTALAGARHIDLEPMVPPAADYPGVFEAAPVPHWSVSLPGGMVNAASHTERSRPVIVGEHVLVGAAAGNALYMLSRRDGGLVREFAAKGTVQSEATVVDERVFFTDSAGSTWCYQLTGELVWEHPGGAPILVQPTVVDGTVYITDVEDLALALHVGTGELTWRYQRKRDVGRQAELALFAAPRAVVVDGLALFGFSDGSLVALDASSGNMAWERRVGEGRYPDLVAAPAPHGDDVYAAGYFMPFVAIDKNTRNVRWRLDIGAASAALVDDAVDPHLIYHPGSDGVLRAVVGLTGAELWTWDSGTDGALTTPVKTDAGLLVGSGEGGLFLIHPTDGSELWRFHDHYHLSGIAVAPSISGRQALFVTNAGRLHSLLAPRGARRLMTEVAAPTQVQAPGTSTPESTPMGGPRLGGPTLEPAPAPGPEPAAPTEPPAGEPAPTEEPPAQDPPPTEPAPESPAPTEAAPPAEAQQTGDGGSAPAEPPAKAPTTP
jgi:outer membrane protein assembly factor BamB